MTGLTYKHSRILYDNEDNDLVEHEYTLLVEQKSSIETMNQALRRTLEELIKDGN